MFICILGCSDKPKLITDHVIKDYPAGISKVERVDSSIILTVTLKDVYKIQLLEGERQLCTTWINSKVPTPVVITIENNKLRFGFATEEFDTLNYEARYNFNGFTKDSLKVIVGYRTVNNIKTPFYVKLVPLTKKEIAHVNE